ncbi:hypothetical protein EHS25_000741 [Saitozyma podzolica]|jgi:hypothetical protein|uniref:Uncharacterized protein n=1 Tax=Saitozyma podzolica TaxID=1890683 RepID=A0A427YX42_9TREE|nr:hypothetical protein EHS25_000741 [Saitozyma podzolica]
MTDIVQLHRSLRNALDQETEPSPRLPSFVLSEMSNGVQLHPSLLAALGLGSGETSSASGEAAPTTNADAATSTTADAQSQTRSEGRQDDDVTRWLRSVDAATTGTEPPSGQSQASGNDNAEDTTGGSTPP